MSRTISGHHEYPVLQLFFSSLFSKDVSPFLVDKDLKKSKSNKALEAIKDYLAQLGGKLVQHIF
jgi:hypothetical protein